MAYTLLEDDVVQKPVKTSAKFTLIDDEQNKPNPTEGNSFAKNYALGLGKAGSDFINRSKQLAIGGTKYDPSDEWASMFVDKSLPKEEQERQIQKIKIDVSQKRKELQSEIDENAHYDKPLMDTVGGSLGNITPAIAASFIPGTGTIKGATALGATQGFMKPVESNESDIGNTVTGGLTAGGITAGLNTVGKIASPLVGAVKNNLSPYKQRLIQAVENMGGVVTPGQKLGKPWMQKIESALERDPLTSKWIDKARDTNQKILNQKGTSQIGETSQNIPDDLLGRAYNRIGDMFDSVKNETIVLGKDFGKAVNDAGYNFNRTWTGKGDSTAKSLLDSAQSAIKKGTLTGEEYNLVRSDLSGVLRSQAVPSNTKQLAHDLMDALDDVAERGISGGKSKIVSQARNEYKKLLGLEKSLNGENISGAKLSSYLTKNDKSGYARGNDKSDLYEMLRFQRNFPDAVGNSGTPTGLSLNNNIVQSLIGGGLGAGYGAYSGDPTAALYGAAAPIAAKKGAEYLYRALGKYATMNPVAKMSPEQIQKISLLRDLIAQGSASHNLNTD